MSYAVYRVSSSGLPRDHHAIFVETGEIGPESGHLFNVIGDIQTGMTFESKPTAKPDESSLTFLSKERMGSVTHANYPRILTICQNTEPPKRQFQGPKRLYPDEPLRRCQEWTAEVIKALVDAQILEQC